MAFYDTLKHAVSDNRGNLIASIFAEPDFDRDEILAKAVDDSYPNVELVRLLLKHGADVNAAGRNGRTPLKAAIYACNDALINDCLERGADVNFDGNGHTPLHVAVEYYPTVLTKLLELGADPNTLNPYHGQGNALHTATRYAQIPLAVMEALLARITDVNALDRDGFAALHSASFGDREDAAKLLLAHGADVNVVATDGNTPLHLAARQDHIDLVLLFLGAGADLNRKNVNGLTPAAAAENAKHYGMKRMLEKRMVASTTE